MKIADNKEKIIRAINSFDSQDKPAWGQLTPATILPHLADTFRIALKEKPLSETAPLPKWLMKWMVIYAPFPWPRGVKAPAVYFETGPQQLEQDKKVLIDYLNRFDAGEPLLEEHSIFGRMTPDDWDALLFRHFRHHFRQFGKEGVF